jgi:hypothetical protein
MAMSLRFKIVVLVLVVLTAAGVVWFRNVQAETRKHSPVQTATLATPGIEVMYCSPGVKDRAIFGGLVPYNEVWRTGANEPTTFDTQVALQIGDNTLEPGIYTLWTIPGEETWQVIWNSSMYPWGVSWGGKPSRKPEKDVLTITVPVTKLDVLQERLNITLTAEPLQMQLAWENTSITVPMQLK